MKLISWNVNGIRACVRKGFLDYFKEMDADIFCIQETKLQEGQIELDLEGYFQYWNYATKKGYSGTAVFTKRKPLSVMYGVGMDTEEAEGRILTLEFEEFFLVNVYTPNSQRDLARLDFRLAWEEKMLAHLQKLDAIKPVIFCGDLNVAHMEIDLKNPKPNKGNSGFTEEEREKMTLLLQ
ncbi:MAG TPA: exodeoxyribonuclease III, partial [Bacillus sp. (in: firmicutes)]|nr:exodeoxyribonuclease III [Bacillus sp. (in: firmicutes)]